MILARLGYSPSSGSCPSFPASWLWKAVLMAQALGFPPPPGLQSQLPTHADSWKQCLWVRQQGSCHFLGDLDCMPIPSFQPQPLQIFGVWINRWEHLQINFWKCHHWVSSYFKTVARTSFFTYKLSILKEKLCMMVILVIQLPNNANTLLPYLSPIKNLKTLKRHWEVWPWTSTQ